MTGHDQPKRPVMMLGNPQAEAIFIGERGQPWMPAMLSLTVSRQLKAAMIA
jgi:alkanesulfonate monooxygenase SsuD/methylene tetrahydromethanopterin reductase-like flavin-dependent oxidoreductase (luciferase family)